MRTFSLVTTILMLQLFCQAIGIANVEDKFSDQAFADHIRKLKKRIPDGNFHIVVQKPFVVVGDDEADVVDRWSKGTVQWAVTRIKKQYFPRNPNHIIDIWLFKDRESYESNCEKIIGYKPHTPFGFYSPHKKALVMNISTGGGTLVHEIVHPFIESNFPDCPSWFNEGLASLYEQCGDNGGRIWGKTNWRLRGLQIKIQSNRLPSTKDLCSTTTEEFYESDSGDNYAQARYLCYYLQEKNLLNKYYHSFNKNAAKDPTGFDTLKSVLDESNMEKFDDHWREYCLKLRFP